MQYLPIISARRCLFAALALAVIAFSGMASIDAGRTPAAAQSGSQNPMFQRHFWRGQSTHGNFNIDARAKPAAPTGAETAEALVEDGTAAASIARRASDCASRFRSYDPSSGTYIGQDGRPRACR